MYNRTISVLARPPLILPGMKYGSWTKLQIYPILDLYKSPQIPRQQEPLMLIQAFASGSLTFLSGDIHLWQTLWLGDKDRQSLETKGLPDVPTGTVMLSGWVIFFWFLSYRQPEHPWRARTTCGQFPWSRVRYDLWDGFRHQLNEYSSTCGQGMWDFIHSALYRKSLQV